MLLRLWRHRVPQIIGLYLACGWFVLEVTGYLDERYGLPGWLPDVLLALIVGFLPAMALIAWRLGPPGDQDLLRSDQRWIGANLLACLLAAVLVWHQRSEEATAPGSEEIAAAAGVHTGGEPAADAALELPPPAVGSARAALLLLPLDAAPEGEDDWRRVGFPTLLDIDLNQTDRLRVATLSRSPGIPSAFERAGYPGALSAPVSAAATIAARAGLTHVLSASLQREADGSLLLRATLYATRPARSVERFEHRANDMLELIDLIAADLRRRLIGAELDGDDDLPIGDLSSRSEAALAAFSRAIDLAIRGQRLGEASQQSALAVAADPRFALGWLVHGQLLVQSGQVDASVGAFTTALRHSARLPAAMTFQVRAIEMQIRQDFTGMQQLLELWTSERPNSAEAWGTRANIELLTGRNAEAYDSLQQALRLDPSNPQLARAAAPLLAARSDLAGATELLRRLLRAEPEDVDAAAQLSDLLQRQGELQAAERVMEQTALRRPEMVSPWTRRARLALAQGELERAESLFRQAAELARTDDQRRFVQVESAYLHHARGDLVTLREVLAPSLEHMTTHSDIQSRIQLLAQWLVPLSQAIGFEEARAQLDQLFPEAQGPLAFSRDLLWAYVCVDHQQLDCIRELGMTLERSARQGKLPVMADSAEWIMGSLDALEGDPRRGAERRQGVLERLLRSGMPMYPAQIASNWREIGHTWLDAGDREAAEAALRQAQAIEPRHPMSELLLLRWLLANGRSDEAAAIANSLRQIWRDADPGFPEARRLAEWLGARP